MKRFKVLFISNGHGEDTVSSHLIQELLRQCPDVEVLAFPLVGNGGPFLRRNIPICGPASDAPKHGFGLHTIEFVGRVLRGNFLLITSGQRVLAEELRGRFDLAVAVGDGIPALVAKWLNLPYVFVGVNKSHHYREHGRRYLYIEQRLLRRALVVFTRDAMTAKALEARRLKNVSYVGNPMMDCRDAATEAVFPTPAGRLVCLLTGSYDDVYLNMEDLLAVSAKLDELARPQERLEFAFAAPGKVTREQLSKQSFSGWTFRAEKADASAPLVGVFENGTTSVRLFNRGFWEILSAAELVIGLAGTANEQAAGLGKPIVSFPTRGVQYTRYFGKTQRELLGEALSFLPHGPEGAAEKAWEILNHAEIRARMAAIGRERMERRGAVGAMAKAIIGFLEQLKPESEPSPCEIAV